jgi:hypothetical protein
MMGLQLISNLKQPWIRSPGPTNNRFRIPMGVPGLTVCAKSNRDIGSGRIKATNGT